jgi:hypothetical protein
MVIFIPDSLERTQLLFLKVLVRIVSFAIEIILQNDIRHKITLALLFQVFKKDVIEWFFTQLTELQVVFCALQRF